MARLDYNEEDVNSALETLTHARDTFTSNTASLVGAINTVAGARGSQYIDYSGLNIAPNASETIADQIDNMSNVIKQRVEAVIQYNYDYDHMSWGEKLFDTIGLGISKVFEGLFGAVEQIVDGFASIVGWVGGLFSSDFKDSVGEFIKKDYVGDAFHDFYYNTDIGKSIVKGSVMGEDSFGANVCKIFGTAVGYAAAIACTGGIVGAASGTGWAAGVAAAKASLGVQMAAGAIGGMGSNTQAALKAGYSYDEAMLHGVKGAAVSAALVWGVNKVLSAAKEPLQKAWGVVKNKAGSAVDKVKGLLGKNGTSGVADIVDDAGNVIGQAEFSIGNGQPNTVVQEIAGNADDVLGGVGKAAANNADDALGAVGKAAANSADDTVNQGLADIVDVDGNVIGQAEVHIGDVLDDSV